MSWDNLYLLANYWAFAGWAALAFAPRGPRILALILYAGAALLCLAYTVLIIGFLTGGIDLGGSGGSFGSLAGVMKFFDAAGKVRAMPTRKDSGASSRYPFFS